MKFKIVGDSCTDFTPEDLQKEYIVSVPLSIEVGGVEIVDDDTFDQADFLRRVEASPDCPKSACPSPEAYMNSFEGAEDVYVVTLSAKLSGSYNSACLAKQMYEEEHPEVNIHVVDSKSAAAGQLLIAYEIEKRATAGLAFTKLVEEITAFRDEVKTAFVLETLEVLRKNGRLSNMKAAMANLLNIKPYMKAVEGQIEQEGQARGIKQALTKMIEYIGSVGGNLEEKDLIISNCNCLERARSVEQKIKEQYAFRSIKIIDTKGISSLYAADGGIIIAF
ncbi:MAG: DegV family protein [Lachnospiraceae bacterium]|nr:DegV family protein [Lachnospiraceae bacterium]